MASGSSPQSPGRRVFISFLIKCIVSLFDCVFVLSIRNIFHTPMARCSLFILNEPLNTNKPYLRAKSVKTEDSIYLLLCKIVLEVQHTHTHKKHQFKN